MSRRAIVIGRITKREFDVPARVRHVQVLTHDRRSGCFGFSQGARSSVAKPARTRRRHWSSADPDGASRNGARPSAKLQDVEVIVDEYGWRRVVAQRQAIGFAREIRRVPSPSDWTRDQPCQPVLPHECQLRAAGARLAPVDLVAAADELEQVSKRANRLRVSQHEKPRLVQREMKDRQQAVLHRRRHVDEDVPATHQVDAGERRIDGDVLACEHARVTHALVDPVGSVLFREDTGGAVLG